MNALIHRLRTQARAAEARTDLVVAIVALALAALVVPTALRGEGPTLANLQIVGYFGAIAIAAMGLNLLVGYVRLVSLGQGAFFAVGAYASAWLLVDGDLSPLLAILVALVAAGAIGAVLAVCSMRLRGPAFAMITLVVAILVEQILVEWRPLGRLSGYPNALDHGSGLIDPVEIFGLTLEPPLFAGTAVTVVIAIVFVAAIVFLGYRNAVGSAWGRSLRAIGTSEHLAAHLGVNVFSRKVVVMAVASVYGALGGVFYAQVMAHLQPETFDIFLSITIVLAVILGGGGTVVGPVIGAAVIVILQQTNVLVPVVDAQRSISDSWYLSTPGLIGLLLVLTLAFLPHGIVGSLVRLTHRGTEEPSEVETGADDGSELARSSDAVADAVLSVPTDGGGENLLEVRGAVRRFGGLTAVGGVDLTVRRGTVHALIGPNGAGKTTLANLVTGVYAVNEGELVLEGQRIDRWPTHRIVRGGVARTFQTPLIFAEESVEENVLAGFLDTGTMPFWRAWLKLPGQYRRNAEMRERAEQLLELVGLAGHGHLEAGNLSYGKQRALEIARALASGPKLLILDEPAAGLNTSETSVLGELLIRLRDRGLSLILVEHHMDLVTQVSDEVTCMNTGVVLAHGSTAEVLADPAVVEAYLGVAVEEGS
ncbi:branched-chain amino acid ABC transporter ATP-binding protein/permease [Aeromicrobium alkaliterrae]|uniref:Branched-chain amino acid ABC transporter ATP-binding protein/permease n=1 Tax=Aeromicrobium alkaliterrae TaxID=302168 RepID=A0ABP4W4C3_9ACTN